MKLGARRLWECRILLYLCQSFWGPQTPCPKAPNTKLCRTHVTATYNWYLAYYFNFKGKPCSWRENNSKNLNITSPSNNCCKIYLKWLTAKYVPLKLKTLYILQHDNHMYQLLWLELKFNYSNVIYIYILHGHHINKLRYVWKYQWDSNTQIMAFSNEQELTPY